jgi:hypothetical protein
LVTKATLFELDKYYTSASLFIYFLLFVQGHAAVLWPGKI